MLHPESILETAKELHRLSPEKAKELGYQEWGSGDDTGGSSAERVIMAAGKILVTRGKEWAGPSSTPRSWGPYVEIYGKQVRLESLSPETRRELDSKLTAAFQPLFDALEAEKSDAPRRKAAVEAANRKEAAEEARRHDEAVKKMLSSL